MSRISGKSILFTALWLDAFIAIAQVPRGESAGSGYEDAFGALWIFAAVAIYAAFKKSQQTGLKALALFVVLGVIYAVSPVVGGILVGMFGVVIGIALFMSFM